MILTLEENIVRIDGVEYHLRQEKDFSEQIEKLRCAINDMVDNAKLLYGDMRKDGLSYGLIEAEGYLRAANDISAIFEEIVSEND